MGGGGSEIEELESTVELPMGDRGVRGDGGGGSDVGVSSGGGGGGRKDGVIGGGSGGNSVSGGGRGGEDESETSGGGGEGEEDRKGTISSERHWD